MFFTLYLSWQFGSCDNNKFKFAWYQSTNYLKTDKTTSKSNTSEGNKEILLKHMLHSPAEDKPHDIHIWLWNGKCSMLIAVVDISLADFLPDWLYVFVPVFDFPHCAKALARNRSEAAVCSWSKPKWDGGVVSNTFFFFFPFVHIWCFPPQTRERSADVFSSFT